MSTTFVSKRGETTKSLSASYQNIYSAPRTPVTTGTPWVRNSSWLALTVPTGSTEKFTGLMAVFNDNSNLVAINASGSLGYTVDWGDGTVENVATGVTRDQTYTFSSISAATEFTMPDGTVARQVIVNVTPNGGTLTGLNLNVKNSKTNVQSGSDVPWLDVAVNMPNCSASGLSFGLFSGITAKLNYLEHATINSIGSCTGFSFANCIALQSVEMLGTTTGLTSTSNMFASCARLQEAPFFNTANVTNASGMFNGCSNLVNVPYYNFAAVTNAANVFTNCYCLESVPLFNLAAATTTASMFSNCYGLKSVPGFNLASCTSTASMFVGCVSLTDVGLLNTPLVQNASSMFSRCYALPTVPLFNLASCTNTTYFFEFCYALKSVPLLNLSVAQSGQSMFYSCQALESVPLFNLSSMTTTNQMFSGCASLTSVPLFNLSSCTVTASMFAGCTRLKSVPAFNLSACTNANNMFFNCYSLTTVGLMNLSACGNIQSLFYNCSSLTSVPLLNFSSATNTQQVFVACTSLLSVPLFNLSASTNANSMFAGCTSLTAAPLFNLSACQNVGGMFSGCNALTSVPSFNVSAVTTGNMAMFGNTYSLRKGVLTGVRFSISYANSMLAADALTDIFNALLAGASQTITISGNHGAPTPVSLSGTTTAGSTTITMANTTGIVAGMQVTGTGTPLTTPIAVTFQDAGDAVTLTAHGLSNGDEVSFATIVSTTGIVINTIYYVVNAATDTFQVAATAGGGALPLTTNGSGTMRYRTEVVSVVTNTSVTLTRKATSSGTNTLAYQTLKTGTALLKGWAVSQ